ncbi:MAG: 6-phosphogluconolactonase [Chloroflexi bacterium]|nr:6-phosphogluconolactonase [Chloroflexota bacterium]MBV9893788.1 6-phosphogluconolactonase [Chloroflexota bacterium]
MTAIRVLPDPSALADAAARHIVEAGQAAIDARGGFSIALSGGSTPRELHRRLASSPLVSQLDWSRVHVFFGDERCVPPEHPESNYRMASETLLSHVPIPSAQVHRMRGELEPAAAAASYEEEMRTFFGDEPPRLDVILLGMGDNGHTASLFPGLTAVHEQQRWVVAEYVGEVGMWRLTLTPPVLNLGREVLFLVAGSGKASMLRQVLEGPYAPDERPAQVVRPSPGEVIWLVDAAAAANLSPATG